jgi:hypothetical protein
VHKDVPEVWENNVLISGGKHYGHLEVDILPSGTDTWQAILEPVYIFPVFDPVSSTYSGYERRIYNDEIVLNGLYKTPKTFSSSQNYPNPFSTKTTIEYSLPEPCHVTVKVFDLQGKFLRILDDGPKDTGFYKTVWDGKNERGKIAASGLYFYKIETSAGQTEIKRMVLLK